MDVCNPLLTSIGQQVGNLRAHPSRQEQNLIVLGQCFFHEIPLSFFINMEDNMNVYVLVQQQ